MTMDELKPGQSAYISSVGGSGALRHHLLDMGLTPQTEITLQKVAPMGDPVQFQLRGYELTLRLEEARKVTVDQVHTKPVRASVVGARRNSSTPHPGVGELVKAGGYHTVHDGAAIPKGSPLTFALAGNQNCGKTTLFNQLTGSNQHVGNFPGVTVDRKDGTIRSHPEATVTDLPGIYSLSPYSNEEIVTRDFLLNTHPSGIINIVDASNIERNLYLTMQLMELGIPMVLALNMMDEVRANGGSILVNELEQILGIPVVPVSAAKNEGIDELIDHAIHVARYREVPVRVDFCPESRDSTDKVGAVHRCIHAASMLLAPDIQAAGLPVRFSTTKLVENDELIGQKVNIPDEKKHAFDHLVNIMEQETGMDREAALANMRFTFLQHLCEKTVVRPRESREHRRSMQIDRLLTGKYTAIPCFIGIMAIVFLMTFSLIGAWLSDLMSMGVEFVIDWIAKGLEYLEVNPVVQSLVVDGVCAGVGSVLSFLPTIVTLFFFLSILEDTGYMARVAFVMDRPLRKLGLSGRSFVPMLVGFGCSVPAIMATRTLSSERDRKMTILLTPFMSCSGKAAHLHDDDRGVLPGAVPCAGNDRAVRFRHSLRNALCPATENYKVPRRTGAVRDGASELPPAKRKERGSAHLGKGEGLHTEGVHSDIRGVHHRVDTPELRCSAEHRGIPGGQPAGSARRVRRTDIRTAGLRRLESLHRPADRLHR